MTDFFRYPDYLFLSDNDVSKSAGLSKRYSDESLHGVITDIELLSDADFLVCTFSSQVIYSSRKTFFRIGTNVSLLYPLKTSENLRFSSIFRRCRSGTLVENGLMIAKIKRNLEPVQIK